MIRREDERDIIIVNSIGLNLSNLLFNYKNQRREPGLLEKVLAVNPGLSAHTILPLGAEIIVPIEQESLPAGVVNDPVQIFS
ncbi:MAG: tail protein X [Cohaesibacter sp.]|nr:tail protein X [Cohaesibacter sp.]